jgi:chromate transporter
MSLPELWGVDVPILLIIALAAALGICLYACPHSRYALPPQTDASDVVPPSLWFWGGWLLAIAAVITLLLCAQQYPLDRLMLSFLRVGALTFGGGYSAVPLFQREAVTATQWLTNKQFLDGLALGQITPGPVLITATFIGYRVAGVLGAVLGTIAVFLPGGLTMYFAASQHERVQHLRWLQALVKGIVAGFIGVLLNITIRLALQSIFDWKTIVLAVASTLALTVFRRDPLWVILGGAVLALLLFR